MGRGRAVAEAGRSWLLTGKPRVLFRVTSCAIRNGRSNTAPGYSPNFFSFPQLIITPPLFHTRLSMPPEVHDSLIRQHIIISSVFVLKSSYRTRHWVGYNVKFEDRNEGRWGERDDRKNRKKLRSERKDGKNERYKLSIAMSLGFL
jgi:hypothetical protein